MTTRLAHRRTALRPLTALALGVLVLTGCGGGGDDRADDPAPATSPPPSASPEEEPDAPTAPEDGTGQQESPGQAESPGADAGPGEDGGSEPADPAPWAGTKQFVQIEDAWTSDGRTYLSVRPAKKEAITEPYEAWVVVPGEGPHTTVPMAEDARILLSVPLGDDSRPGSYSQDEFVGRLTELPAAIRPGVGYDLSFDGEGRVTRLQSLYTS